MKILKKIPVKEFLLYITLPPSLQHYQKITTSQVFFMDFVSLPETAFPMNTFQCLLPSFLLFMEKQEFSGSLLQSIVSSGNLASFSYR